MRNHDAIVSAPQGGRALLLSLGLVLTLALGAGALHGCGGGGGGGGDGGATQGSTGSSTSSGRGGHGPSTGSSTSTGSSSSSGTRAGTPSLDAFAALRSQIAGLSTSQQQAQLDAFIAAQRDSAEGFPLRSGRRAGFVWKGTAQPYVAGDWNGWSATAAPLARIGATSVWYAEQDVRTADRHEYKLVVSGQWQQDPLNRKFAYGYQNSILNVAGSQKSHLERVAAFRSATLGNTRDLLIYLPAGYLDDAQARYPVIYMHDGQNLFDPTAFWGGWGADEVLDQLIAAPAGQGMRKVIVVGVANTPDRMNEYTHVPDDLSSSCNGRQITGGKAPQYATFLVSELKPWVDARYQTSPGAADTAILGSSLGGLVSIWTAYAHPGVFGSAAGMSSTFDWGSWCLGNDTMAEIISRAGKRSMKIYIDCGGVGASSPGDDNWGGTEDVKHVLEAQGFVHGTDLMHWWQPGAEHNEAEWHARLDKPLRFFFGR